MAEYLIPKPLPFCKLGLANLPLLLILSSWDWTSYLQVVFLKILGSLWVGGTLFSPIALIAASGGIASALVMKGLFRLCGKHISLLGISVMGALASNLVQIEAAALLVYGPSIRVAAPLFCLIGLASSIALGLIANACKRRGLGPSPVEIPSFRAQASHPVTFLLLAMVLLFLTLETKPLRLLCIWILLLGAQKGAGKKIRLGYPLMLLLSLVFLSLLFPTGKVLWSWGPFTLSSLALSSALGKGLRLICMTSASQSMTTVMPSIPFRGFRLLSETLAVLGTLQLPQRGEKPMQALKTLFSGTRKAPRETRKTHPLLIGILSLCAIVMCASNLL